MIQMRIIMAKNDKKNIIDLTDDPIWFDKNILKIWGQEGNDIIYYLSEDFRYSKLYQNNNGSLDQIGITIYPFKIALMYMSESVKEDLTELAARSTGSEWDFVDVKDAIEFANKHDVVIDKDKWFNSITSFIKELVKTYETSDIFNMYDDIEQEKVIIRDKFTIDLFKKMHEFIQNNHYSDNIYQGCDEFCYSLNKDDFTQENIMKKINSLEKELLLNIETPTNQSNSNSIHKKHKM